MKKILCVIGATATGKTKLAVELAQLFHSTLISADSRQVYRGMDIVTGKDHPPGIKLAGIDIFDPAEVSSVAGWYDAVESALNGKMLPIIVGGTGLYVRAATVGIPTMHIPPNNELRRELEKLSISELVEHLAKHDKSKLASMNESDSKNPRRLIRAIELAFTLHSPQQTTTRDSLIIGLQREGIDYSHTIRQRVISRLENGAVQETETLLREYPPSIPSMSALGYKHISKFILGELSREQMIEDWTNDELAYAKRQMTWFKKIPSVYWFDTGSHNLSTQVADLVKSWYHSN